LPVSYVEVRSADLTPDDRILAVPALWTGILYDDDALDRALALGKPFVSASACRSALDAAAKDCLAGQAEGVCLGDLASSAVSLAIEGLSKGAACAGTRAAIPALGK